MKISSRLKILKVGPLKRYRITKIQIFQLLRILHPPIVFHYTFYNQDLSSLTCSPHPQQETTLLKNPICLPFINALHMNLMASQKFLSPAFTVLESLEPTNCQISANS